MSNRSLVQQFEHWKTTDDALALVTVTETAGSTYSKSGRHILIRSNGEYAGLVSGGCLEGDLAEHAAKVIATGETMQLTYDMRDDADELWGIGVGCNGMIKVLVQRVGAENDWLPFATLATAIASSTPSVAGLLLESNEPSLPIGSISIRNNQNELIAGSELPGTENSLPAITDFANGKTMHWLIQPWPRILLLGGGPDAEPVCELALAQGWHVTVADHRPTSLAAHGFANADHCLHVTPTNLAKQINLLEHSAIVIMSHHLETDCQYVQQLADHYCAETHRYIGALGPTERRHKLLASLTDAPAEFAANFRGPVGLDIGADSPESIALALISEIQAVLNDRSGSSLSMQKNSS